jgi:hypothetical protein
MIRPSASACCCSQVGLSSCAGAKSRCPPVAAVEVADEIEQPRGGGIQMRGQLGDLVAKSLQLDLALRVVWTAPVVIGNHGMRRDDQEKAPRSSGALSHETRDATTLP